MTTIRSILLLGSGGREHAIAQKLAQSPTVNHIFVAPGNGGTSLIGPKVSNVSIDFNIHSDLITFARSNAVDLVVVGPEQPLVDGVQDSFKSAGISCFGPSKRAAQIEGSKAFSKDFMRRHNIPTADYQVFTDLNAAIQYVQTVKHRVVIKASGLAAGKGVLLPTTKEEAVAALRSIMADHVFGLAGNEVVVEEFLEGEELSVLAFSDGYTVVPLPPAQDHKRAFDNDQGPNTGGMGAYAPAPLGTPSIVSSILNTILKPTVDGLRREGTPYVGILYAGLMISPQNEVKVLEFNCRFGDPETQVLIPLLADDCDLAQVMLACCEGRLDSVRVSFRSGFAATVVAAAPGYPNSYPKGAFVQLNPQQSENRIVCVAGAALKSPAAQGDTLFHNAGLFTSGGRVLSVTGLDKTLEGAVHEAYEGLKLVSFEGMHYRKDIAHKALTRSQTIEGQITYAQAGVDIVAGDNFVERIKPLAKATARSGCDSSLGGFGGLFDLKATGFKDPILVAGTDGVGTKLRVAQIANVHDTIGIDLVAMSVNDLVVQGAEPLFFLDYYATSKLHIDMAVKVVEGIALACKESGCALIGGETAEMPGMYTDDDYDLAGFAVGAVERHMVLPVPCSVGDIIIGLPSSGIHSNGYSLVRHLIKVHGLDYAAPPPFASNKRTLAEALLVPTRLYVEPCTPLAKQGLLKAMAHITGGGLLENIPRVLQDDIACELDANTWQLPPVFSWLAGLAKLSAVEMARTFNCGIGMIMVVSEKNLPAVRSYLQSSHSSKDHPPCVIGRIIPRGSQDRPQVQVLNTLTAWNIA